MAEPSTDSRIDDLDRERTDVLSATELDTSEAEKYLVTLTPERFASCRLNDRSVRPLIQPRGGFPSFAKQRELTLALHEVGADFIPLTIDSFTRHNDYARAAALLEQGRELSRDLLNGYPLVAHGHGLTRRLYEEIDRPVSLRHGTPDARLLVEVALASGITEIEGGGLTYTLPYTRRFPLDRALRHWQYVDRLCALTSCPGAVIHRESFGVLTATLVPPVIVIVIELCELLLAAEQGVKSFAVSFGQSGSLEQDISIGALLRDKATALLNQFSFGDVKVSLVYHEWMGAFPLDRDLASHAIAVASANAALVGADKVVIKTPEEAFGIPQIESTVRAVQAVRYVLDMFPQSGPWRSERTEMEKELLESEVDSVLERIFSQPGSSFDESVYRCVLGGIIDVPFSPHDQNQGRLLTVRDDTRSIRIIDPGLVPLSPSDLATERSWSEKANTSEVPLWQRLLNDVRILA